MADSIGELTEAQQAAIDNRALRQQALTTQVVRRFLGLDVTSLRTAIDSMPKRDARAVKQGLVRAVELLEQYGAVPHDTEISVYEESTDVRSADAAEPVSDTDDSHALDDFTFGESDEPTGDDLSGEPQLELGKRGISWAQRLLGERIDPEQTSISELTDIILTKANNPAVTKTRSGKIITARSRVMRRLAGQDQNEIAEADGTTRGAVSQWFVHTILKPIENPPHQDDTDESEVSGSDEDDTPASDVEAIVGEVFKDDEEETAEEAEQQPEPRGERSLEEEKEHVQIARIYADLCEFDSALAASFEAMVDPTNRGRMQENKHMAVEMILKKMKDIAGDLVTASAVLDDKERIRVQRLLGYSIGFGSVVSVEPSPIPLSEQLSKVNNPTEYRVIEMSLYSGLRKLAAELQRRLERGGSTMERGGPSPLQVAFTAEGAPRLV